MSRISERQKQLGELELMVLLSSAVGSTDDAEVAMMLYCLVHDERYLTNRTHRSANDHYFTQVFPKLTDLEFQRFFRTTKPGFVQLVALIENSPSFQNRSNCKQAHPAWQLAIALHRFGHYGNRMGLVEVAHDFGIAVGTVELYTKRVVHALGSLSSDWVKWPDESRRKASSRVMSKEGFPGCVGFLDGTLLPLYQKPSDDGASYFDRAKRYSVLATRIHQCKDGVP